MQVVQLSELQERVLSAAIERLRDQPWYSGICVTSFPSDEVISQNFDDAVAQVCDWTESWDNPDIFKQGEAA